MQSLAAKTKEIFCLQSVFHINRSARLLFKLYIVGLQFQNNNMDSQQIYILYILLYAHENSCQLIVLLNVLFKYYENSLAVLTGQRLCVIDVTQAIGICCRLEII